jgi:hypothetical protein
MALKTTEQEIADLEEDRDMVLGQSGHHVSGGARKRFDERLNALNQTKAGLLEALEKRVGPGDTGSAVNPGGAAS